MAKKNKGLSIVSIIGLGLFGIAFMGAIIAGSFYYKHLVYPNIKIDNESGTSFLYIKKNASTADVLQDLYNQGIVQNKTSLEWMAAKKNYRGANIVSGKYEIADGMTNNGVINHLRAGNGLIPVKLQFNQLRDIAQLSGKLTQEVSADSIDMYNWLNNPDSIAKYGFNEATIPALFIPNTYYVNWDMSPTDIMQRMAKEYKAFWTEDRKSKAKEIGLSQSEVTTMASIVYWETKMAKDMPTIAGVYMNRIRIGMPLQADPTLIYALGDYEIRRVLNIHKEIDSPYNTYKNRGLPPGPIIIPPIKYVDAVLNYEKHDYLYFVAKEDFSGYSYFSETYSQHLAYARLYQAALNKMQVYQ